MGGGFHLLPAPRREPRRRAVPEAVEQSRRRLQEDQGVGGEEVGARGGGFVLVHEERFEEGEEVAGIF